MRKRNWWQWLIGVVILVGVCWPAYNWTRANIKTLKDAGRTRMAPVIMVPGSSASQNRFDSQTVRQCQQCTRQADQELGT